MNVLAFIEVTTEALEIAAERAEELAKFLESINTMMKKEEKMNKQTRDYTRN
jgi:hypothetical protein